MNGLRIFLADDHSLVRRGIRSLLGVHSEWEVCGEATDGKEALEKVNQLNPDVLILDINMPELNGLEVTRRVHRMCPKVEVLVLTVQDSEQAMKQALEAGARGYMLKSDAGNELLAAVETVRRHHLFLSSQTSRMLRESSAPQAKNDVTLKQPLSPRERQFLQLLAEGRSTKEIATALEITIKTAETHRANIMRKLDLHHVTELVRYAIRNQIVQV
jgi:DNA-binding NarL/FixJ family response regulator